MAISLINLHDTKRISHPDDKTAPTIFEIGAIDSRVFGKLQDRAMTVSVDHTNPNAEADVKIGNRQLDFDVVQFGLKAFENLHDAKAGAVIYKTERLAVGNKGYDVVASTILSAIPGHVLQWLAGEIRALNSLPDADVK